MAKRHNDLGQKKRPRWQMNRLGILLICLVLTIAATAFSIWFNLNRVSGESKDSLFEFIRSRLETGIQESGVLSNR
jgi:hypothetical protein